MRLNECSLPIGRYIDSNCRIPDQSGYESNERTKSFFSIYARTFVAYVRFPRVLFLASGYLIANMDF